MTHDPVPVVSVVIPTRNRAEFLPRAIESVRAQTFHDFELIVVDDASTDETPRVLRKYAATDPRVVVRRLDASVGAAAARNRGLARARGEFVAFLDDDDEWLPGKLERQLAAFRAEPPDVGVVHTAFVEVDARGRERVRGMRPVPPRGARARLLAGNLLGHSTVLVRRPALESVGGFDERLPRLQDWDLWIRLAAGVRFRLVPMPLVRVHATAGNISTDDEALRRASAMLRSKLEDDDTLTRRELTNLYHGLGRLLVEHGMAEEGRRLILRSLKRGWWPPQRVFVAVAALLGPAFYRGVAGAFLDSVGWLSSVRTQRVGPDTDARGSRGRKPVGDAAEAMMEVRTRHETTVGRPTGGTAGRSPPAGGTGTPLVSIVIPAYESRRWVCDAIDSALDQTYPACEVIVIDDGSTDGTGELVKRRYGDDVTCEVQPNRGQAAARNRGLSIARGEYVQFLDADDVLLPDKIAVQVAALEERPEHSVAYCDFAYFDAERPERTWSAGFQSRYRSGDVFADLLRMNFIVCHAALARTADLREVGGFDGGLASCQDYDLWLRLAAGGRRFIFTPGVMALYRQTPNSMSTDWAREFASTVAVLDKVPRYAVLDRRTRRIRRMHRMLSAGLASLARLNAKLGVLGRPPRQRRIVRALQSVRAKLRSPARSDDDSG